MGPRRSSYGIANLKIEQLRGVMCDADDYDPEDGVAHDRSMRAKALAKRAYELLDLRRYHEAIMVANKAIKVMEGNL
jgi:hypothetical protein